MRGRWLAVAGLTLMTVLIGSPQASAQTLPPEVTSNVTCETVPATGAKYVKLGASIKNPNTAAIAYTVVRTWSDGRTPNIQAKTVAAGATVDANLLDNKATSVATQWTYTMVVKVDGAEGTTVAGPFTSQNPCMNPPEVTYTVTCTKNATTGVPEAVVYAPTIKNPNTVAVTYTLVRGWSDGRADVTSTAEVAAGATAAGGTLDYTNSTALTTDWTHTLTIKIGDSVTGTPITKQNPCFTAPTPTTDPPEVGYEVTCQKNGDGAAEAVVYAPTIKNPNTVAITYTLVLSWSDERDDQTTEVPVAAGATVSGESVTYSDDVALTTEWTNTLTVKEGDEVVGDPITKENPCFTGAPTSTTTSDPAATTTTDVASTSSGNNGGLAATGIAIVAVLGVGLVLFANGAGLMRLVRKGEHE